MTIKRQPMRTATATISPLRSLAFAGLAGAMIVLATAQLARAESAVAPAVSSQGVTTAQKASIPPATREEKPAPATKIDREYLIKAAILFNFAKFASWPESSFSYPGAPIRICVLGEDPFGAALDSLHGKQVRNRPLAISRIDALDEAPMCHIMFVSASEETRIPAILDYVGRLPILTVADMSRFANSGGIIALKEVNNRSRIEINIGAAEQAGVRLSSKLLRLADMVSTQAANDQAH